MSKDIHLKIPYRYCHRDLALGEIFYPIIDLEVLGVGRKVQTVPFILDTGTATSFVGYDVVRSLLGESVRRQGVRKVLGVGGTVEVYITQLACRLSGVEFSLKVFFPSKKDSFLTPNLLGRDFLKFFNVLLKEKDLEVAARIKKIVPKEGVFYKFSMPTKAQIGEYYDMRRTTLVIGGDVSESNIDASGGKIKSPQTLRINSPDAILKEVSKNANLLTKSPVGEWDRLMAKIDKIYLEVGDDVLRKRIRKVLKSEFEKKIKEDRRFVKKGISWLRTVPKAIGTIAGTSLVRLLFERLDLSKVPQLLKSLGG